jgi:4-alpha-glucanotransferase
MHQTYSYQQLEDEQKNILNTLYNQYFFENQNELWQKEGTATLSMLAKSSKMLLCAEDLGMVPPFTEKVLADLNILSLQIQQMPKIDNEQFSDTHNAKYPCVVMPATHDMAPIRLWWEQNKASAQLFFNRILKESGTAPYFCEPWVCKKIIELHLQSPAMWSVFLLQDLMAIDGNVRRAIPAEERINDPANPNQIWNYRMHVTIEKLMEADDMNHQIKEMIKESGR